MTELAHENHPALSLDNDDLGTLALQIRQRIAAIRAAQEEQLAPYLNDKAVVESEIVRRITENGAKALAHYYLSIELRVESKIDKRIDVLRRLEGLVPDDILRPALSLVQPPPAWQADGTKLNALARKYGGDIAEIIAEGMPRVQVGAPKLEITERVPLKTVNPTSLAA